MIEDVVGELKDKASKTIESFKRELSRVRTGRANLAVLEPVRVNYYGSKVPLNQVATVTVSDARLIVIKPWEKAMIAEVEKAINVAEIGLTPQSDGEVVRLPVPALTEERRKELVKLVHKRMEEAKVEIRNHRRDELDIIRKREKDGDLGADESHRQQEALEKVTHKWTDEVDRVGAAKEAEVLEV